MEMEQGTRTRLATVVILLLVLVSGSVVGIALDRRLARGDATAQEVDSVRGGEGSDEEGSQSEDREPRSRRRLLVEQVGLSEVQKAQVDSIVSHYRERMRELQDELEEELRQAYQPRYRELLEGTREEIRGVLSPAQQVQYDSILAEHDRRRQERRNQDADSTSGS